MEWPEEETEMGIKKKCKNESIILLEELEIFNILENSTGKVKNISKKKEWGYRRNTKGFKNMNK